MNIVTVVLYEKLHRYIYEEYFHLKKTSNTDRERYWYEVYKRYEHKLKGWRIVISIWLPFVRKYRRYAYYNTVLSSYELNQVSRLSRLVYRLKTK